MNRRVIQTLIVLIWLLAGCPATVGTSGEYYVPKDSRQRCESRCTEIGMELGAVAIMANEVGCVCRPSGSGKVGAEAAVSGGMATIMLQRRSQQQAATTQTR
jgi:hypothetical protein